MEPARRREICVRFWKFFLVVLAPLGFGKLFCKRTPVHVRSGRVHLALSKGGDLSTQTAIGSDLSTRCHYSMPHFLQYLCPSDIHSRVRERGKGADRGRKMKRDKEGEGKENFKTATRMCGEKPSRVDEPDKLISDIMKLKGKKN
eukprot:1338171-Amorphochlora_amoeboformis.AAC.1